MSLRKLALFALSLLVFASCSRKQPPRAIATLVRLQGTVTVERTARSIKAQAPAPLYSGDWVVSGHESGALIHYPSGQEVEVSANTRFRLEEHLSQVSVTLEEGILLSRAPPTLPQAGGTTMELLILTPYGKAALTAGSSVRFSVLSAQGRIEVLEGQMVVVGKDGQPVTARSGDVLGLELGTISVVAPKLPPPPPKPTPLATRLLPQRGKVFVRQKEEGRLSAQEEPTVLSPGASFMVPRTHEALWSAEGLTLQLSDATGSLRRAEKTDGVERYELELHASRSQLNVLGGGNRELVLVTRAKKIGLQLNEESTVLLSLAPAAMVVDVHTGALTLSLGTERKLVRAGEVARIEGEGIEVLPHEPTLLSLPLQKRLRVFTDGLSEVALTLPESAQGQRVEVASDAGFSRLLASGRVEGPLIFSVVPPGGELHWRVLRDANEPFTGGDVQFERERDGNKARMGNASAEVSETGLKASVFFQTVVPDLTFSFTSKEGASKYRFRIYRAANLTHPVLDQTVTAPQASVESGQLEEGEYVWYAAPLDSNGAELTGGRMNKLQIVYDNFRRSLAIFRPARGETVRRNKVQTEGVAPLGSKVYVNGKLAPLDDKGRFALQVPSSEALVFRLTGEKTSETYWVRRIRGRP